MQSAVADWRSEMPITIYPPIPIQATISGVLQTALPPNAAQETAGQLQRIADLMENVLLELKVLSAEVAQLNDGVSIDPEQLRSDPTLAAQ